MLSLHKELEKSSAFLDWKKEHEKTFLSHYFAQIDSSFKIKGQWDIGYYDPTAEKITIFSTDDTGSFFLKNTDDVFKQKMDDVEELNVTEAKIDFDAIKEKFIASFQEHFPDYTGLFGDGFIILQNLKQRTVWNCSLVTKKLSMVNIKLSATSGEFVDKTEVNFLDRGA